MPLNYDLRLAITNNDLQAVRRLLESGADANGTVRGTTPLSLAIYRGYTNIAELLIGAGADVRLLSLDHLERKEPPLCSACRLGNRPLVEMLLKCPQLDSNQTDLFGKTPLWLSVKERRADLVEMLINSGVDVGRGRLRWGESPLYLATRCRGRAGIALMLIFAGCPAEAQDLEGKTALYWTTQNGEKNVFCALLLSGAPWPSALPALSQTRLPDKWMEDESFVSWALINVGQPLSLVTLARNVVRRRLVQCAGQVDERVVAELGIPTQLRAVVQLDDVKVLIKVLD